MALDQIDPEATAKKKVKTIFFFSPKIQNFKK